MKLDTLIVACKKENFESVFINEKSWYPILIKDEKVKIIKYVISYQKAPISSLTHIAEVKKIVKMPDNKKYKIIFKGTPKKIIPIEMGENRKNVPQNPRYGNKEKILKASSMDDIY
ncbi:hypothetical protein [Halobacteriovorax sp. DPLXC-1]|uniref:hypothetical protein n=1 Tax=Halobacteriovorax sp. DPLXC-1 TaxID=3110771 RepID=UPI002FF35DEF